MADILYGAPVAAAITDDLLTRCRALQDRGVVPTLALVRPGDRPADLSYGAAIRKRCQSIGIDVREFSLPEDAGTDALSAVISRINADAELHGCLVFSPLPQESGGYRSGRGL